MRPSPRRTRVPQMLAEDSALSEPESEEDEETREADLAVLLQARARYTFEEFDTLYGGSRLGREILIRELKGTTRARPTAGPSSLGDPSGSSGHSTDGWISTEDNSQGTEKYAQQDTVKVANEGSSEAGGEGELAYANEPRDGKSPEKGAAGGSPVEVEPATLASSSRPSLGPPPKPGPPRLNLRYIPSLSPPNPFATTPLASTSSAASNGGNRSRPRKNSEDGSGEYETARPKKRRSVAGPAKERAEPASRAPPAEWTVWCHFTNPGSDVECGAGFVRTYDLKRHEDTVHYGALPGQPAGGLTHKCPDCDRMFSRKDAMLRHRKTIDHSVPVEQRRGPQGGGGAVKKK